uniref:F-box domain-containing protein n=1 Tax=Parastrongyloides trichosuri TaxID=131310 RepID=A0A0N5A4L8_PARTI
VSDQIEEISYIELFSLLNYGKEFNLLDSEIFDNKSNLNKFFFYADINKFSYTRENFNNELDAFLKLLSKHKHITYSFSIALNDLSMKIAYKIAEYCEENTIHFQFCFCKPITGVSYFDYFDLDENVLQIKSYITCIKMYLREFKCFKKLEIALSSLEELESIIINIDYNFTAYVVKEFGNCKNFFRKLDNNIFLRIVTKNLKKLEISFIENQDINKKEIKHYDRKRNKILAKLLSYFPNSVKIIMFENINKIEKFVFIQMGFYFPQLETITFKGINEISDVACVKIKSLRNVIIYGELKIEIPPWIDIVIFRYCHCQNMLQYKTSDLKNIDYYFNLMNTKFDCSLQKIDDGETVEIVFLRDVLNWNNFIKL